MAGRITARGFGWRHSGRKDPVFSNLDLDIEPGERVLLLGASGSGKSTLLAGIAGVLGDEEDGIRVGTITVDTRVGMVLQDPDSQVIAHTVGDDVVFGCENFCVPREQMWERARRAIEVVGLNLPFEHPTRALSGGQKQRLALAGVLAMEPGVIVLDEPTANLDPHGVIEVRDAVLRAVEATGATLIVVEHRTEIWLDHVNRVLLMGTDDTGRSGSILADGAPSEILSTHAEQLVAAGVWVPTVPLCLPSLSSPSESSSPLYSDLSSSYSGLWSSSRPAGSVSARAGEGFTDSMFPHPPSHPTPPHLIEAHDLSIGWSKKQPIQQSLDISLSAGSTVLTGRNGTGKSTLALTLGGLLPALAGEVDASGLSGRTVKKNPYSWRSTTLIRHIGYVFQDPEHQFAARTVRDELLIGPKATGMDAEKAERYAEHVLDKLGLAKLARANPYTLSGGEKRRLSVASMLTTRPGLLILDEPTFGQDRVTFSTLVQLLQGLVEEGVSLLSISHDDTYAQLMGQHRWELSHA